MELVCQRVVTRLSTNPAQRTVSPFHVTKRCYHYVKPAQDTAEWEIECVCGLWSNDYSDKT